MRFTFTAATERAIAFASDWCSRTGREELDPQSLLVGLLSESECRAAVMLQKQGVDIAAVCQKWPTLTPATEVPPLGNGGGQPPNISSPGKKSRGIPFSPDVEDAIQLACDHLDFLPRRPELATEHLLLGLVLAITRWGFGLRNEDFILIPLKPKSAIYSATKSRTHPRWWTLRRDATDRRAGPTAPKKVMQLANQEAHRFNHRHIGVEHILLGLLKDGVGAAGHVLKSLGANLGNLHNVAGLNQYETDIPTMGALPLTPGAKKVIEHSTEEAWNLNQGYVNTMHILLAMLRDQDGVGAQTLRAIGLNPETVRGELLKLVSETGAFDWRAESCAVRPLPPRLPPPSLAFLQPMRLTSLQPRSRKRPWSVSSTPPPTAPAKDCE